MLFQLQLTKVHVCYNNSTIALFNFHGITIYNNITGTLVGLRVTGSFRFLGTNGDVELTSLLDMQDMRRRLVVTLVFNWSPWLRVAASQSVYQIKIQCGGGY